MYKMATTSVRSGTILTVHLQKCSHLSSFSIIKQLMPALAVNIIIVHPWDDVFRQGKALWKTTPLG
jgi:hypothetical protein